MIVLVLLYFSKLDMSNFFEATKKWGVYDDGDYDFLDKHFAHHYLLETDIRYKSNKGRVQIQEHFNRSEKDILSSAGQVKFEIPLPNSGRSLYSRITSHGKYVLSYDNGHLDLVSGAKLNFFGSLQTSRGLKDSVYKFGIACLGSNYNYAFRWRYHQGEDKGDMVFHAKGSNHGDWSKGTWRLNFFTIYSPAITKIIKNGLLFGLTNNQTKDSYYLRVETGKKAHEGVQIKDLFRVFKLNWTRTVNPDLKLGFETKLDFHNWEHLWSHTYLGAEWCFPASQAYVKAKVSPNLTTAVSVNRSLGSYGDYSVGFQLKELGKENKIRWGAKIRLNI